MKPLIVLILLILLTLPILNLSDQLNQVVVLNLVMMEWLYHVLSSHQKAQVLLMLPLTGHLSMLPILFHRNMIKNNHLLKSLLMNHTCHISPNTLMDSGTNSDSDHQNVWMLTKSDKEPMVLLELLNMILIATNKDLETEPYLSS